MCAAFYLTYLPVIFRLALRLAGMKLPEAAQFTVEWIYHTAAAVNGFLYIALHSSVRRELRRYLPRCRRDAVAPASTQPAGDDGCQLRQGRGTGEPGAPVPMMMMSFCPRTTDQLITTHRGSTV